ncbi:SRPBCC family protein [Arthrobacter sp. ISL-30]|uniref:SRPBCC family protein n=1 Tax=Arthrobacter sp. ISL-30 TaxID=2819109 RepID=UPI001BEB8AA7|nr:SRPBCC family protein [Arthrobacter sp. ISL-30]MBT2513699.1 SRPBCC family protein [Arthrobacter sp. ISL-30]
MSSNTTTVNAPANTPFVDTEREFDAPVKRVFKAFTDPALVEKWMGPRGYSIHTDVFDACSGGSYRFIHRDQAGNEYAFRGVFHEVQAPLRIVQTFEFEGYPGQVSLETVTFEDLGSRCRIMQHSVFPTVESRDMFISDGLESGMRDSMDRLDELVS